MRPKIAEICEAEVAGWNRLPTEMLFPETGEEAYTIGFVSYQGIQMMASVRDDETLHVSLAMLSSFHPNSTENERLFALGELTPKILANFFGEMTQEEFAQTWFPMPDDERKTDVKHWVKRI